MGEFEGVVPVGLEDLGFGVFDFFAVARVGDGGTARGFDFGADTF